MSTDLEGFFYFYGKRSFSNLSELKLCTVLMCSIASPA
ncbi:hypothetical protein JCM19236_3309 [Vibrio sp. JCM 19236]|nr:hypothetical protein JCM19236_3309 [Vibrio sp. JCM 19236]